MQLKITQFEAKISPQQAQDLNDTLFMQLGRYTQIIDLVSTSFKKDIDQFGDQVIHCHVDVSLIPEGITSTSNTATSVENAFYNAISRAKRQLDRQRGGIKRQFNPNYTVYK